MYAFSNYRVCRCNTIHFFIAMVTSLEPSGVGGWGIFCNLTVPDLLSVGKSQYALTAMQSVSSV